MSQLAPPPLPPRITTSEDDGFGRLRTRMFQVTATLATSGIAVWCCTLGALPGIIAVMIAKHVIVAVLLMDRGLLTRPER